MNSGGNTHIEGDKSLSLHHIYLKHYDMEKEVIEKKIKEKLDEYGVVENDLTPSELEELKSEVETELNGGIVLDGVLFHIPYFDRIAKREKGK